MMKIDRLLGLVMYLLNRDKVSARELAERFEVSPRTVQRDMEALNLAGIPVTSIQGASGGYAIMDSFRLDKQIMNTDDYLFIITALKGLCTAYENRRLEATLEKFLAIVPKGQDQDGSSKIDSSGIRFDLDISREGVNTGEYLNQLETAVRSKRVVEFDYTDAVSHRTHRRVEPVILLCKWYSWYLFGYCLERRDYRLFRLSRIRELVTTPEPFLMQHDNPDRLLAEHGEEDRRIFQQVKMVCQTEDRIAMEEYFPNATFTETPGGKWLIECSLPENERGWFGILMSYGAKVRVLEPEELRSRLVQKAREITEMYR